MSEYTEVLREFHLAAEQLISELPTADPGRATRALRSRLMREELMELLGAMRDRSLVRIADGIADLLYVVFGTAVSYGIPVDSVFRAVHRANMAKLAGGVRRDRRGKVIKPPGWVSPEAEIEELLKSVLHG